MADSYQQKRDTTANWETNNPVLPDGVIGIEKCVNGSQKFKIGNGMDTWNNLKYPDSIGSITGSGGASVTNDGLGNYNVDITGFQNKFYDTNANQLASSSYYMKNGIITPPTVYDANTVEFTTNTTYGALGLVVPNTSGNKYIAVTTVTNTGTIDATALKRIVGYNNTPAGIASVLLNGVTVAIYGTLSASQSQTFVDEFTSASSSYSGITLQVQCTSNGAKLKITQKIYAVSNLSDAFISIMPWINPPEYIMLADVSNNSIFASSSSMSNVALSLQHKWHGKVWDAIGDSITDQNHYEPTVQTETGMSSYFKDGISGASTVSYMTGGYLSSSNISASDVVTVFIGTNDYGGSVSLGTINDAVGASTTYGALKWFVQQILNIKPTVKLAFITPIQRGVFQSQPVYPAANSAGYTLDQYVQAVCDIAEMYALPVLDLFRTSGINTYTYATYLADGLHPSWNVGGPHIGKIIASWLEMI